MAWDRKLWGVELHTRNGEVTMIGANWDATHFTNRGYHGEPTRALLFTTRTSARQWCSVKNADYAKRGLSSWRLRPARVRETIRIIKREKP